MKKHFHHFTTILLGLLIAKSTLVNAQKLGINTTEPTATLDVNGGLRVRGGTPATGKILVGTDANGHTTWKNNRVAFRAKGIQGGGLQNIAYNTSYRLYFAFESYDYGGHFNLDFNSAERSKFTAPATGVYHFSANCHFMYRMVSGSYVPYKTGFIRLMITRNGVTSEYTERRIECGANQYFLYLNIEDDIRLQTGDKIWVEVTQWNEDDLNMPLDMAEQSASFACHLVFEE